jgi:hypothetical protein
VKVLEASFRDLIDYAKLAGKKIDFTPLVVSTLSRQLPALAKASGVNRMLFDGRRISASEEAERLRQQEVVPGIASNA